MDNTPSSGRAKRQLLGKRMGLDPYYTIVENTDTRLELGSRPDANMQVSHTFILVGMVLFIIAMAVFGIGFMGYFQGIGTTAFIIGAFVSTPFGILGLMGIIGGMAIGKTINTIVVDRESQTITYIQQAKRERKQIVDFGQIASLRMSTQQFNTAFILKRPHPIAVLEFITKEDVPWVIDSAADPAELEPVTEAFGKALGLDVTRQLSDTLV